MTDDKTPIANELHEPSHHDKEEGEEEGPVVGTASTPDSRYRGAGSGPVAPDDDNDSDCLSTTTSCTAITALGASQSQLTGTIRQQPSPPQSVRPLQAYDNPCLQHTTDLHTPAPSSTTATTTTLDHHSPTTAATATLGQTEVPKTSRRGSEVGGCLVNTSSVSPSTAVPASVSMPTSLKNSAAAATSSPSHNTSSDIKKQQQQSNNSIASPSKGGATPTAQSASNNTSSATTPMSGGTQAAGTAGSHSRCDSWVSGGVTSGTHTVCHSRGASTEGSTIDVLSSSATESRRGTYSEAGTLPIGSLPEGSLGGTIIEEEQSTDKLSEKKLSSDQSLNHAGSGSQAGNGGILGENKETTSCNCSLFFEDCCRPILQKHNPLPSRPTRVDKMKYAFTCPPHGKIGELLTFLLLLLLVWGALYAMTGSYAAPGGVLFSVIVTFVCSVIGGKISEACGLPPLLGMLLVGIALNNVPGVKVIGDGLDPVWSASIRNIALVVILLRAGLGLDPKALRSLSFVVFRLAFTPCVVETVVVAIVSHFLLGFPWMWGLMLGFILAAVSPAVVVPCLLQLSQMGYGVEKGIPTLVIAAASVDDVLAISGFGIMLGMTFSQGSLVWQIFQGPLEVLLGLGYGLLFGLLCWILPNKHHQSCAFLQFCVLFAAGLFALFGSHKIEFGGAGALAVLSMAFIAGVGFRKQGWGEDDNPVGQHCNTAWTFLQPMLFALIGTEIQIQELQPDTIGLGIATLCVSLTCRVLTTFFVVMGSGLNIRERLFVALAWLPKATVQAAIGSTALDYATSINAGPEEIHLAQQVLTIAVLVILITAPIGAIAIMSSAPRLLQKTRQDTDPPSGETV